MKQPIKGGGKIKRKKIVHKPKFNPYKVRNKTNQQYGTSQLERDFAKDFLDKYGIRYIYQYEAKDIKRFFDFAVISDQEAFFFTEEKDGMVSVKQDGQYVPIDFIVEVDGSYFHADPRLLKEGQKLNSTQKHSKFVDEIKNRWCREHHIPLLRIWEYDIRHNPQSVIDELSKYVDIARHKNEVKKRMKRPH